MARRRGRRGQARAAVVARVGHAAFDEDESGLPRAGSEAVAERSCEEEWSAQTREYAPLLASMKWPPGQAQICPWPRNAAEEAK
jgi:hypothetical protein